MKLNKFRAIKTHGIHNIPTVEQRTLLAPNDEPNNQMYPLKEDSHDLQCFWSKMSHMIYSYLIFVSLLKRQYPYLGTVK